MLGLKLIARAHCLAHAWPMQQQDLPSRPDKTLQKYALLNTQHDVKHLLTHHLRPRCLENLFDKPADSLHCATTKEPKMRHQGQTIHHEYGDPWCHG